MAATTCWSDNRDLLSWHSSVPLPQSTAGCDESGAVSDTVVLKSKLFVNTDYTLEDTGRQRPDGPVVVWYRQPMAGVRRN